jgi:hypothetical protein
MASKNHPMILVDLKPREVVALWSMCNTVISIGAVSDDMRRLLNRAADRLRERLEFEQDHGTLDGLDLRIDTR